MIKTIRGGRLIGPIAQFAIVKGRIDLLRPIRPFFLLLNPFLYEPDIAILHRHHDIAA